MFEIVFLGTSASAPSIQRGLSAQVVLYKEHRFLVDCGEGTQRQILRSELGFRRLNRILLTHGHLDHILGLGGLISTFVRWEAIEEIEIWGGKATLDRVKKLLFEVVLRGDHPGVDITFHTIRKGGVIIDEEDFTVSAFPVTHRGPGCFGYCFQERSRRPFLADQAEALDVPVGPERRRLVEGKTLKLADGRLIKPDQVLGELIPGRKLCITGDVSAPEKLLYDVAGADLLVSEATYSEQEGEMARQYGHLTARDAAELARDAGVKNLILTHLSRRHRESDLLEEARAIFPATVVARDFDHYRLRKDRDDLEKVEKN